MNTEILNRWLSLGANLAVLIGIVFLAMEIQQNTEMTRAQITQSRAEVSITVADMTVNSAYVPALVAKNRNGEALTQEEAIRYQFWLRALLRNQDNNIQQYNQGLLGQHIPRATAGVIRGVIVNNPAGREFWSTAKSGFSDEFIEFVDGVVAENER